MKRLLAVTLPLGAALLLGVAASFSQEVAQETKKPEETTTIRMEVKNVTAPVIVTRRDGTFVNGLREEDFRLFDNEKRQKVKLDVTSHPISMVIAIQANTSVEAMLSKIQKMGPVVDSLVTGEDGEVSLLAFDHRIQTLQEFTNEPGRIADSLKKLKMGSTSARLNDAVMQSINMLRNRPAVRKRVILLISESRDRGSEIRAREVMTAAEFNNVVIYTVEIPRTITALTEKGQPPRPPAIPPEAQHVPAGGSMTPTMQTQTMTGNAMPVFEEIFRAVKGIFIDNPAQVYTKFTGGREYAFASQKSLERAIADIGEELHSQYVLTYSPNNQEEAGYHHIRIEVMGDYKVRTRGGYYLAGKPQ